MRHIKHLLSIILLTLALLFIYIKLSRSTVNIHQIFSEVHKPLLFALIGFQIISYFGDGWLSKILLKIAGFKIRFRETVTIAILGVLGGQFTPFIGGTMVTYYFYRRLKIPSSAILFMLSTWTFFLWLTHVLFFVLSLFYISKQFLFSLHSVSIGLLTLTSVFLIITIPILMQKRAKNLFRIVNLINAIGFRIKKKNPIDTERLKNFISDAYKNFNLLLENKKEIPKALLASILLYLGNVITLYCSFLAFGFRPDPAILIFGYTLSLLLTVFTLIPATPGVMETSLVTVFVSLGFPSHLALFSVLLFRLFSYWLPLPLGAISYFNLRREKQ